MNFDQKAVKFLANFYINGGRHWARGPLRSLPLLLPQPVHRTVVLLNLKPRSQEEDWFRQSTRPRQQLLSWPVCTQVLQQQLLGQRPPILTDLDVPGPATYKVHDTSVQEPSPHPHIIRGCKSPIHECPAQRLPSQSPFMQKTSFLTEQKAECPSRSSQPADPTFWCRGHSLSGTRGSGRAHLSRVPAHTPAVGKRLRARPMVASARGLQSHGGSTSHSPPLASWVRSCSYKPVPASGQGAGLDSGGGSWGRAGPSLVAACTPGPTAYRAEDCDNVRFPSVPGVVIHGVRRPKRHNTGPFCAI